MRAVSTELRRDLDDRSQCDELPDVSIDWVCHLGGKHDDGSTNLRASSLIRTAGLLVRGHLREGRHRLGVACGQDQGCALALESRSRRCADHEERSAGPSPTGGACSLAERASSENQTSILSCLLSRARSGTGEFLKSRPAPSAGHDGGGWAHAIAHGGASRLSVCAMVMRNSSMIIAQSTSRHAHAMTAESASHLSPASSPGDPRVAGWRASPGILFPLRSASGNDAWAADLFMPSFYHSVLLQLPHAVGPKGQGAVSHVRLQLAYCKSRPAGSAIELVTRNFNTGTRGFATPEDARTAVCVLPGTELAFDKELRSARIGLFGLKVKTIEHTTAIYSANQQKRAAHTPRRIRISRRAH